MGYHHHHHHKSKKRGKSKSIEGIFPFKKKPSWNAKRNVSYSSKHENLGKKKKLYKKRRETTPTWGSVYYSGITPLPILQNQNQNKKNSEKYTKNNDSDRNDENERQGKNMEEEEKNSKNFLKFIRSKKFIISTIIIASTLIIIFIAVVIIYMIRKKKNKKHSSAANSQSSLNQLSVEDIEKEIARTQYHNHEHEFISSHSLQNQEFLPKSHHHHISQMSGSGSDSGSGEVLRMNKIKLPPGYEVNYPFNNISSQEKKLSEEEEYGENIKSVEKPITLSPGVHNVSAALNSMLNSKEEDNMFTEKDVISSQKISTDEKKKLKVNENDIETASTTALFLQKLHNIINSKDIEDSKKIQTLQNEIGVLIPKEDEEKEKVNYFFYQVAEEEKK